MQSTRNSRIANRSVLFAVLVLLTFVLLPIWPYSTSWGLYPSVAVIVVLAVLGVSFFRVMPRNL